MEDLKIGQMFCSITTSGKRSNENLNLIHKKNIEDMKNKAMDCAKRKSVKESIGWLKKLAELDDVWGLWNLGRWYEKDGSPEHDLKKALDCYEKAVALGRAESTPDVIRIEEKIRKHKPEENFLKVGSVVSGKVINIIKAGLLVKIKPSVIGLVHNSNLSWKRNIRAEDVAEVGDEIQVVVQYIDEISGRAKLSIKDIYEDPWKNKIKDYHEGDIVEAKIARFIDCGIIAEIDSMFNGIIYKTEISRQKTQNIDEFLYVLDINQSISVEILKINFAKRKISLKLISPEL